MRVPQCYIAYAIGFLMRVDHLMRKWLRLWWGWARGRCHRLSICWCPVSCGRCWRRVFGKSGAIEEEYVDKWPGHGFPLRASALDTYTSALLWHVWVQNKKSANESSDGEEVGVFPRNTRYQWRKHGFRGTFWCKGHLMVYLKRWSCGPAYGNHLG